MSLAADRFGVADLRKSANPGGGDFCQQISVNLQWQIWGNLQTGGRGNFYLQIMVNLQWQMWGICKLGGISACRFQEICKLEAGISACRFWQICSGRFEDICKLGEGEFLPADFGKSAVVDLSKSANRGGFSTSRFEEICKLGGISACRFQEICNLEGNFCLQILANLHWKIWRNLQTGGGEISACRFW